MSEQTIQTRKEILAERRRLRRKYRGLYDDVTRILFRHDPMQIGYAQDEYEPETELILPRIAESRSAKDLAIAVHDAFSKMFDPDMAGPVRRYEAIARDIWRVAHGPGPSAPRPPQRVRSASRS